MEGAAGRGARGGRGARSAAARGRGAARGAARASSRGRGAGGSPGRAVTLGAQQRDGAAARRGRPAQRAPAPRSPPAGTAAGGGEVPPAPRSRAAAARAPAAQRRAAVPDGAVAAPAAARVLPPAAGPLRLREVVSRLTLPRQDVSDAADVVNQVVSQLIQAIRSTDGSFSSIERLGAGSYYEHVKITEPNEFDIMLVMPVARLQLDESDDTGAFYYLTFKRNPKEKYLLKFLDEDGKLSAFKMLEALRGIIKREVKNITRNIENVEVTVKRRKSGSPAITLQIKKPLAEISVDIILTLKLQQSWPPSTQDGLKVEQWLGRKVRRDLRYESVYLVAKQNKKEKVLRDQGHTKPTLVCRNIPACHCIMRTDDFSKKSSGNLKHYQKNKNKCFRTVTLPETNSQAYYLHKEIEISGEDFFSSNAELLHGNTWRLSFSHIEKTMLNNHGSSKTCCESDGPKCCRKSCLKLLKYLVEQLKMKHPKELDKICSYHVKTAFFHSCVVWPNDTDWTWGDLDHCFQKYLGYFLDCLEKYQLPHFFIPQYNLLSLEDKASCDFLSRQINQQLNNRFPIFQEMS